MNERIVTFWMVLEIYYRAKSSRAPLVASAASIQVGQTPVPPLVPWQTRTRKTRKIAIGYKMERRVLSPY